MTAYQRKMFNGGVPDTVLGASINSSVLSFTVSDATSWVDGSIGPFNVVLDPGQTNEEKVLCSGRAGTVFTVLNRGVDGTAPTSHNATTCVVRHCLFGSDSDEANLAVSQTVGKITTKGDLIPASGAAATTRLGVGADGTALVADQSQAGGMKWSAPIPAVHDHSTPAAGGNIPESSVTGLQADLAGKAGFTDLAAHAALTSGVHGAVGNIVDTTSVQNLSGKTYTSPVATNTVTSAATAAGIPLTVTAAAAQTADTVLVQDSSSNKLLRSLAAGGLSVLTTAAANVGLLVTGAAAATADLLTVADNAANLLFRVIPGGGGLINALGTNDILDFQVNGVTKSKIDPGGRFIGVIPTQKAQVTSSTSGIAGTLVAVVTAPSITADGSTPIRVTVGCAYVTGSQDNTGLRWGIYEGSTELRGVQPLASWVTGSAQIPGSDLSWVFTPTAGAHVYSLSAIRATGSGAFVVAASATEPAFIRVETA